MERNIYDYHTHDNKCVGSASDVVEGGMGWTGSSAHVVKALVAFSFCVNLNDGRL